MLSLVTDNNPSFKNQRKEENVINKLDVAWLSCCGLCVCMRASRSLWLRFPLWLHDVGLGLSLSDGPDGPDVKL